MIADEYLKVELLVNDKGLSTEQLDKNNAEEILRVNFFFINLYLQHLNIYSSKLWLAYKLTEIRLQSKFISLPHLK